MEYFLLSNQIMNFTLEELLDEAHRWRWELTESIIVPCSIVQMKANIVSMVF